MQSHLRVCIATIAVALCAVAPGARPVSAQCLLANPSFEILGGSSAFASWNQFGVVGVSTSAPHGHYAVRVSGPNLGGWDVSGVWQQLDTAPGEQWEASVQAWHTTTNPVSGQSSAILNIEWRDAGGNLISYESHTVLDATTPTGQVVTYRVTSGPAPPGTATTHFLLGVLQSPTDPPPDVYYDLATFENLGPPTLDDVQWNDFVGGRTLAFSGLTWRVKGPGYFGPGPNWFSDSPSDVWVDGQGYLHMSVHFDGANWVSTEVTLQDTLGYGDYIFTTMGSLDQLDPNVVLGMFLWQYRTCWDPAAVWWGAYNEIDIEYSRWGSPTNPIGQFVAQPADQPGNISRFDVTMAPGELTSHAFRWLPDRLEFRSWRGGPADESPATLIYAWTYTGAQLPRPEQPRVHVNLWQATGNPAAPQEVVLTQFTHVPYPVPTAAFDGGPPARERWLGAARPNPFNPSTTIEFRVPRDARTQLKVYDVTGRLVRTLVDARLGAGRHAARWDGRDDRGRPVASGVYLYRLQTGDIEESRSMVLLK